ncbi:flagellar biosynthesis protein FliR [Primorskyibacter flagellatus]|uniref:Flagellar biosynthesis protein FliR n=1 Tax=Primorskyibacter flagellatus TaxID=1387277 RepID=A0A917AEQ1_9RHOB|nr:flagellar biosynthetic protein FliR [Primorskyibacter flagellatus]GGE47347.1 flagellar biosynthesis protein FliR [Primorskyibacter flagellatus]
MTVEALLLVHVRDGLWHATLVFLRVAPLMALVPGFSEHSVPGRIKLVLALALTAVVTPATSPAPVGDAWAFPVFIRLLATETCAGLALGIGLRLFVITLQTAGSMAAQAASLSQLAGGAAADPMPAIGHLLVIGGLALAMTLGLHTRLAEYVIASYAILPAGDFPNAADFAAWGIAGASRSFALAFTLAAPFVIVSFTYNLTLGVINRAMPQLMVAFVGAPVITFGGLALLMLLAPPILVVWGNDLLTFLTAPFAPPP